VDILEIEDVLKGLPDQALMQEAQQPSGQVPQYMVVSEIQRRSKMRKRFEAQKEQPSTTVAEQILTGGVASVAPPPPQMMGAMGMPQQPPAPPQQPPMGQQQPPMQPQQMPPQQPPMPQQGAPMPPPVQMYEGGETKYSNPQGLIVQALEAGVPGSVLIEQNPIYADLINQLEAQLETKMGVSQYEDIKQDYIPYGREFDSDLASAPAGPMEEVVVTGQMPGPLEPRGQVTSRALPQAEAVSPAARTIDTRPENLIFNQPIVAEGFEKPNPISNYLAGVRSNLSEMPTKISPFGTYSEITERTMPRIGDVKASDIYTTDVGDPGGFSGIASGASRKQQRESQPKGITFQELIGTENIYTPNVPSGGQMSRTERAGGIEALAGLGEPFGVLRSDAVGFEPLRSQQNILQETISDMALVGDQPVVTDVASSSAVTNDAQTGAVAPKSTGTEITEKEVAAGLSDVTPEDKVNQDIAKSIQYTSPDVPELVAPSFANLISEQERRLAKIREDTKRDIGAQALINLGAGVMEGDVAGGLRAAGQAASKIRTAERAAESDIANLQTRIKMAEEQGKFDTAKALRADALKEAQFEATFGLKRGELAQTLRIAQDRIEAEGNTEKGRALRARLTALNDLASRLQAQVATTGIKDPATDAALQQALSQLQLLLGVKVADSDNSDPFGLKKTG